jgi:hypothetical protein
LGFLALIYIADMVAMLLIPERRAQALDTAAPTGQPVRRGNQDE